MGGYELPHAVLMMVPEAWEHQPSMPRAKRDFYRYHASLMEPWDGPASIAFTDGTVIGAVLDRNGLRPSRYWVTADDLVIMASEVGVLDIPGEDVGDRLNAAVRMPRKAVLVVRRCVPAEIVEQQERIGLGRLAEAEPAMEVHTGPFHSGLGGDDAFDRTNGHAILRLESL
jgi:glutamate synthase (NADPH/NADH) large chain